MRSDASERADVTLAQCAFDPLERTFAELGERARRDDEHPLASIPCNLFEQRLLCRLTKDNALLRLNDEMSGIQVDHRCRGRGSEG